MAAIYQWFSGAARLIDYEYVLLCTNEGANITHYIGINYLTGVATDFGGIRVTGNADVLCDGKNVFTKNSNFPYSIDQYIHRGHAFTHVYNGLTGNINAGQMLHLINNQLVIVGGESFSAGFRTCEYAADSPYGFGTMHVNAGTTRVEGIIDVKNGNEDAYEYGDAFALTMQVGGQMRSYTVGGGSASLVDTSAVVTKSQQPNYIGWNNILGYLAVNDVNSTVTLLYKIDNDLSMVYVAALTGLNNALASCITPTGYLMTLETIALGDYRFRTYSINQSTYALTLVDTFTGPTANPTENASIVMSPLSGRMWAVGADRQFGLHVFDVSDTGMLDRVFFITNYSIGASGYQGKFIHFLAEPLETVPNGFTGIKEKLYECWEFNEVGSVPRVGSLAGITVTPTGTVGSVAGTIGNAADFNGASKLEYVLLQRDTEIQTLDNFSICMEVILDSKAITQAFISRGRIDWQPIVAAAPDFSFIYDQPTDKFCFSWLEGIEGISSVDRRVYSNIGSPVIGQKYHVYMEYDKTNNRIRLSIDNALPTVTNLSTGAYFYLTTANNSIKFGARSNLVGQTAYLDGKIDQVFWFWDTLTDAQRAWMYNTGNSRAYSEL